MIWTAWNNGQHSNTGAGYGLMVSVADRDKYFKKAWKNVKLELVYGSKKIITEANVGKKSFWDHTCRELICKDIGIWLQKKGMSKWPKGKPHKFYVTTIGKGIFRVK